jgi:hypothetical protein
MFHVLMDIAKQKGMETRDFVPACTRIQKRLGIDVSAAALLVLRDNGADISDISQKVYDSVRAM